MYKFEIFTPDTINVEEYENFDHKNLFTTLKWFEFLKEFRHVKPIMIRICDNSGMFTGYFSGAIQSFTGIRILGSPFYGWMGQHMGFDLCDEETVIKHVLIDEIIEFISRNCRISMLMLSDFKFDAEVYEKCSVKLFRDTDHATYFLDLTQTENIVDSIAIFGISSIPIFRIGKDMVFPPFGKRYFLNVTEFSGLMVTG